MEDRSESRLRYRTGSIQPVSLLRARLTATLKPGSYAAAKLLRWDSGTSLLKLINTNNSIRVHSSFGVAGVTDDEIYIAWFADAERYEAISGGLHLFGVLDGVFSAGGTVTVSVWAGPPAARVDTGVDLTSVRSWLITSGSIAAAKRVYCVWYGSGWEIVGIECA